MPNFKIVCNCIHELLNDFENPAQRIITRIAVEGAMVTFNNALSRTWLSV